jgi:hypothetical protein
LRRQDQLASRILHHEILVDRLLEDRFHVEARVHDPSCGEHPGKVVEVSLEHELVDLHHGHVAELRQNVQLDGRLAAVGCLFFPCTALAQREEAVAGEPAESGDALVRPRLSCTPGLLRDSYVQRVLCLVLGHF